MTEFGEERGRGLAESLAAYNLLLDEVSRQTREGPPPRGKPDRLLYLGSIIERNAARQAEREEAAAAAEVSENA